MTIIGCILIVFGVAAEIFAEVYQCILSAQKFGVIFSSEHFTILIPHWSAWFFLVGAVLIIIGWCLMAYANNKGGRHGKRR